MSGITPEGFDRPSFEDIRDALVAEIRAVMGPVNTGAESAIGQQISIMAEREALIWDALEATYHSQYPDTAAGRSLDGAVQLTGITRIDATRTTVAVQLTGDPGTVIPVGSEASTTDGDIFSIVQAVELDGSGNGGGQMQAVEAGAILALAGTLTTIETPVSGWTGITNNTDGETGRDTETDSELRLRRIQSLQITGAGTVPAIRARLLQQVPDVTAVTIIENRTDTVDVDGRPPHSFETVVSGGTDQDVAALLWQVKPAGIETTGAITQIVEDSQGVEQIIRFSRAVQQFIWVKVTLDVSGVGTFPDNAEDLTKAAIVEYGETLNVGDNVLYQALFGPIYDNIPGIMNVTITLAASDDAGIEPDPGAFAAANIVIGSNEIAVFAEDRIAVTINA